MRQSAVERASRAWYSKRGQQTALTAVKEEPRISPTEARRARARWQAVAAIEADELRKMSAADKLRQLAALMASVDALGWRDSLAGEERVVRERWNRLRRVLRA